MRHNLPTPDPFREREGNRSERAITLAVITGAHGVSGEVRLKLLGEGLESLKAHSAFNNGTLRLTSLRADGKGGAIARIENLTSRTAAEALRGTPLNVFRSALPPLEEGEFYHTDIIGLPVVSDAGEPVGRVVAVENFGATDIVEIERDGGGQFMVPLIEAAVPEWDAKRLVVSEAYIT